MNQEQIDELIKGVDPDRSLEKLLVKKMKSTPFAYQTAAGIIGQYARKHRHNNDLEIHLSALVSIAFKNFCSNRKITSKACDVRDRDPEDILLSLCMNCRMEAKRNKVDISSYLEDIRFQLFPH